MREIDHEHFAQWKPYKPPWYPYDNNPWEVVENMSGNVDTHYSLWVESLKPDELLRLIKENRKSASRRS